MYTIQLSVSMLTYRAHVYIIRLYCDKTAVGVARLLRELPLYHRVYHSQNFVTKVAEMFRDVGQLNGRADLLSSFLGKGSTYTCQRTTHDGR